MSTRSCAPARNRVALDVSLACFFVLLDTTVTLAGASWWPAHPGKLAWAMLALQALADASLVARRRAPLLVIAILTVFTLLISLLVSPAGLLTPANLANVWAPYGTVLAAYGPFYYCKDRRTAFAAVGMMTSIGARRRATSEASARACSASMAQASLSGCTGHQEPPASVTVVSSSTKKHARTMSSRRARETHDRMLMRLTLCHRAPATRDGDTFGRPGTY